MKNLKRTKIQTSRARKVLDGPYFDKIRITFDYRFVDGEFRSDLQCNNSQQIIYINEDPVSCTPEDILTSEKKEVLKGTLENVK